MSKAKACRRGLRFPAALLGALLIVAALIPTAAPVQAAPAGGVELLPVPESGRVADGAGILGEEAVARLNAILAHLEARNGVEIGVATVATTEPLTPDMYATELFEAWGVGKRGRDNGLLVLVARRERRVKVEVGYGLEEIFPDGRVGRLLDDFAVPALKQGRYGEGLIALVEEVARIAEAEYRPGEDGGRGAPRPENGAAEVAGLLAFLLILGLFGAAAVALRRPVGHRCPRCKGRMLREKEETLRPATAEEDGLARVYYRCTRCGYERIAEMVLPMLVAGELVGRRRHLRGPFGPFGGGFGGFGGGS
ncbi:MAG: TPM domain-containing protein, partial [Bacillota bacterium]|nr:TPM domain-containing protein [Bacillota bacterium]